MKIIPIILSGGSGTRLWPLSRKQYPKQYLPLAGEKTMLQDTVLRLNGIENLGDPIIVCNCDHRFLIAEQLKQINISNSTILLEPIGRNTAPAIAAAALQVLKSNDSEDVVLLVLSADHTIQDVGAFHRAVNIATHQAKIGKLVTFGIIPTSGNIGYGYIKKGQSDGVAYKVDRFTEKPDQKTAHSFFDSGDYLWNSGMFAFKAGTLINELTTYSREIVESVKCSVDNSVQDLDFIRLELKAFESCLSNSIDYALMEKSDNVVVVSLDAGWDDIGSWSALYETGVKDDNGNVIKGDVFSEETINCYINASHHLVATIGIKDLVIVDTPNATLISSKNKAQEVNKIVERLRKEEREEQFCHRKVYRPWGWYDSIEIGGNFQVKRLNINPGAKLSLQMHNKRAEHWVVVSGTATAINGEEVLTLTEGESTYIPIGTTHGLENKTNEQLEIIEVQSGTYLGEDDIVRFEDIYGRVKD